MKKKKQPVQKLMEERYPQDYIVLGCQILQRLKKKLFPALGYYTFSVKLETSKFSVIHTTCVWTPCLVMFGKQDILLDEYLV